MSYPATASYPASASYPAAATYPGSATYPGGAVPFAPSQVLNTAVFYDGNLSTVGAHLNSLYSDNPPTALCVNSDPIRTFVSQWGTSNNATALPALQQPTATTTGTQLASDGSQFANTTSDIVLDTAQGYTIYCGAALAVGASGIAWFGNSASLGGIGIAGGAWSIFDDGVAAASAANTVPSGVVLLRADIATDGTATMDYTGSGGATVSPTAMSGPMTLNEIGASAVFFANDNTGNRYLFGWLIQRRIIQGSAEDLQIQTYLSATYGTAL